MDCSLLLLLFSAVCIGCTSSGMTIPVAPIFFTGMTCPLAVRRRSTVEEGGKEDISLFSKTVFLLHEFLG